MALTIRMRIDENDEHKYYYATGDGTEIELIPLVVDANGVYTPDENKAYSRVTVNVPETELEELVVTTNDVYTAPSGKAYNVVRVNVQPILEAVSRSYTENGTYTIQPTDGKDGISSVTVVVDVPTPSPRLQTKSESYSANGSYSVLHDSGYDGLSYVDVNVDVPTSNIQPYKQETITQNGYSQVTPDSGYDAIGALGVVVNVPTGGSGDVDVVKDSFEFDKQSNMETVTIPYTGTKRIKYILIKPANNEINNIISTASYSASTLVAMMLFKQTEDAPTFSGSVNENTGYIARVYKNGGTVASTNMSKLQTLFSNSVTLAYSSYSSQQVRIDSNTTFSLVTRDSNAGSSRYAFHTGVEYEYLAIYE